jgi:hypothetical protein
LERDGYITGHYHILLKPFPICRVQNVEQVC